jgi:hypothetical protein
MKQFVISAVVSGLLLGSACHPESAADKAKADSSRIRAIRNAQPDKDQFKESVRVAENKIKAGKVFDPGVAAGAIKAYIDYANEFPNDSVSADYFFRAGGLATASGNYLRKKIKCIDWFLLQTIVADKPDTWRIGALM